MLDLMIGLNKVVDFCDVAVFRGSCLAATEVDAVGIVVAY